MALLDNAQRRAAYGAAGQARVEKNFSLAAYFQQVQSLYTILCSKKV
jgi:glycosyltransferase involved in cell wall biosynthesis